MAPTKQPKSKPVTKPKPAAQSTPAEHPAAAPAVSPKTNTLAIVAIILAFLFPVIGLILGIVALSQIKKKHEGGKGLAVASIIIAIIIMVFELIMVLAFWGFYFGVKNELNKNGVNLDTGKGTVTVQDKNGGSASFGNTSIPDGFPSSVPIYKPSDVVGVVKDGKNGYLVTLSTKDSYEQVQSFYTTQLKNNGWTSDKNGGQYTFAKGSAAVFTKGNQQLTVIIGSDTSGKNQSTGIILTVSNKDASSSSY